MMPWTLCKSLMHLYLFESLILCRMSTEKVVYLAAKPKDISWNRDKTFGSQYGKKHSQYSSFITSPISTTIADFVIELKMSNYFWRVTFICFQISVILKVSSKQLKAVSCYWKAFHFLDVCRGYDYSSG